MDVREGFVESEGHRLAYLAVNEHLASDEEPAIVFIHGVLGSVNLWRDCVPPGFEEGRAWYSLSLPAHHPSTVPPDFAIGDVDETSLFRIMDGALGELLGEREAIVIGHSTGGFCGLNLAAHRSRHVAGVVSVSGFHRGDWGGVEGLLLKVAGLGPWARGLFVANIWMAQTSPYLRRTFVGLLTSDHDAFRRNPAGRRMLEHIEPNTLAQDPGVLFVLFNGLAGLDIADRLHRIEVPCHIFYGTRDPVVPTEQSLTLVGEIPGARPTVFRDVGHLSFLEAPGAYFDALERALEDVAARRSDPSKPSANEVMTYPRYEEDLQRVHESEVYGLAVFDTAARVARSEDRKQKWRVLRALEEQTLARYLEYMRESGQTVREPRGWALRGRAEGAALGLMPWPMAMKAVRNATGPFQERFLRLKRHASGADREFFAYVYAHEKAIEAFAKKELAKEEDSLRDVKDLLED